jgi:hypothetical protein
MVPTLKDVDAFIDAVPNGTDGPTRESCASSCGRSPVIRPPRRDVRTCACAAAQRLDADALVEC